MKATNLKRRQFFSEGGKYLGLILMAPALLKVLPAMAEERRRGGGTATPDAASGDLGLPLVEPGKDAAAGVNYVDDKAKLKKADLKVERQGVKFADQSCAACGFYTKVGMKDGKEVGRCQIFPGKLVVSKGWCSSWNKKA